MRLGSFNGRLIPILACMALLAGLTEAEEIARPGGTPGWIDDPSLEAIAQDPLQSALRPYRGERYRMLADFNADGIQDMALSEDIGKFGKAGGEFTLYIGNDEGKYLAHGVFEAHPKAIAIEQVGAKVRIWTYYRFGGMEGLIGYRDVLGDNLSERHAITIHPGSGGTKMGNAIYSAVFENSALPIKVERSVTENGVVRWIDPDQATDKG